MKFFVGFSLVLPILGARVNVQKRSSPLDVKIESIGNSAVKASITNTGSEDLKVLKTGSLLDRNAVEKAEIFCGNNTAIAFDGLRLNVRRNNLVENSFQVLAAGETVEVEWDPAEVHDLSTGGDFQFLTRGSFLVADKNSTQVKGVVPFDSNLLYTHVDGITAAKVRRDFHNTIRARMQVLSRRTEVQSDCTGSNGQDQLAALGNCADLATAAAAAASNGSADKMTEYFRSASPSTRTQVTQVFEALASECASATGGTSQQYCTDVMESCETDVLAYTIPGMNLMVSCPIYFSELPALATVCHDQDQATTTLHEMTHLSQVKGTEDYGYGYDAITQLSARQNLNNADTYTLFANAINLGC